MQVESNHCRIHDDDIHYEIIETALVEKTSTHSLSQTSHHTTQNPPPSPRIIKHFAPSGEERDEWPLWLRGIQRPWFSGVQPSVSDSTNINDVLH